MTPEQLITELRTRITMLELENTGLRNELWTANRTIRSHDPLEGEDG
jgi:hypothetical protein